MNQSENEKRLDSLLAAFEAGTLPKSEWTHAAHLTVATCYLLSCSDEEALLRLRKRIRYINDCHGTVNSQDGGYHETLTRFWLLTLRRFLNQIPKPVKRADAAAQVVAAFAEQRMLYTEYYTFDVVKNREARLSWMPPDKKILE